MTTTDKQAPSMHQRAVEKHGELARCPMCDAPGYLVWPQEQDWGRVKCTRPSCGTEGGPGNTIAEAVARWSIRAQSGLREAFDRGWRDACRSIFDHGPDGAEPDFRKSAWAKACAALTTSAPNYA